MEFPNRLRKRTGERRLEYWLAARGRCFSQDDGTVANAAGATVRADINSNLQAIITVMSGSSAPGTTYAYMFWADTSNNVLKQRNAANSAWIVRGTLDESFVLSRSSNTMLDVSDRFPKCIKATSGFTQTFDAVATLGDGWFIPYIIDSGVTIVFDPNSSENIDGATTKTVVGPASGFICCNGSALFTVGFVIPATQAQQEAGTDVTVFVTPGRQQYHPSAAKAWLYTTAAGTWTISASYNVTSITDNGVGDVTVNWTTAFSSVNYAALATPRMNNPPSDRLIVSRMTGDASSARFLMETSAGVDTDPDIGINVVAFGDQ